MSPPTRALWAAGLILSAGLAAAIVLPQDGLASLLDLTAERIPPPPELRLASPKDGEGVGPEVVIAGDALSLAGTVLDVQVRIDGGRWTSVPDAPRGQRAAPFALTAPLGPGDHLVEARAWDGEAYSLVARALVRRDAPTLRLLAPADGASFESGAVGVGGLVEGAATHVVVSAGNRSLEAPVRAGGTWEATLALERGVHEVRATAIGDTPSLPARARVAVGSPAPPPLALLTPREGASYGDAGDLTCGGGCILVTGTTSLEATRVAVRIDGHAAGNATLTASGAWSYRIPARSLGSGEHRVDAVAYDEHGQPSVARSARFLARTPLALAIEGADAAQPTFTPLAFRAVGPGAADARWTLDGEPLARGAEVALTLARPGDHVLAVHVDARDGRATSATRPLHALNRLPQLALGAEATLVGARLRLEAEASDPDGEIIEYRWDFGDGRRATTREPVALHLYPTRGGYEATLRAVDDAGGVATMSIPVEVPNAPPAPAFSWSPPEPSVLDVITLRDESIDPDGATLSRFWRLPDGRGTDEDAPTLRAQTPGPLPVTLRAEDELGAIVEITREIPIRNLAPEARFVHEPALPRTHEEILFGDLSLDLDTPLARWTWRFGENETAEGPGVLHVFRSPGLHTVTLTVEDSLGATADATMDVLVLDSEPQVSAVVVDPPFPRSGQDVRFEALAHDRDGGIATLLWDFGDGANSSERAPVHRYARSGLHRGHVTVVDEGGLRASFPFHVLIANTGPSVALALAEANPLAAYPTLLVANATDPDGRVAYHRFDADSDGRFDCEGVAPTCRFVYERPGVHVARVQVEDDEGAFAEAQLLLEVAAPPPSLAPPTLRIESPLPEARLRGDHLVRGEAWGVRPIARVEMQVRNATWALSGSAHPWRALEGAEQWRALVDSRAFPEGAYELVVRATDEGGGVGFARLPILVENGERPSDVQVRISDAPLELFGHAEVRASAFHPLGVTSVRWRVDERPWQLVGQNPLAFVLPLDPRDLAPGEHVLRIEAYRGTSESASATHVFTVPGVAPALVIDEPPPPIAYGLLRAGGRIVGEGHVQWRLDTGLWRDIPPGPTWLLAHETGGIRGGRHTVDLRAISPDGRLTSEIASYRIEVVNPSPDAVSERPARPTTAQEIPLPWPFLLLGLAAAAFARRR